MQSYDVNIIHWVQQWYDCTINDTYIIIPCTTKNNYVHKVESLQYLLILLVGEMHSWDS